MASYYCTIPEEGKFIKKNSSWMLMFVGACALCAVAINVVPATTFNVSGTSTPVRIIQSSAVPAFNAPSLNSGSLVNQALPAPPSANIPSSDMHQDVARLAVLSSGVFLVLAAAVTFAKELFSSNQASGKEGESWLIAAEAGAVEQSTEEPVTVESLQKKLLIYRMMQKTKSKELKSHQINKDRKDIARMLTEEKFNKLRAQGIDPYAKGHTQKKLSELQKGTAAKP
eukprot:EG_transcript_26736